MLGQEGAGAIGSLLRRAFPSLSTAAQRDSEEQETALGTCPRSSGAAADQDSAGAATAAALGRPKRPRTTRGSRTRGRR